MAEALAWTPPYCVVDVRGRREFWWGRSAHCSRRTCGSSIRDRAAIIQKKTKRPVQSTSPNRPILCSWRGSPLFEETAAVICFQAAENLAAFIDRARLDDQQLKPKRKEAQSRTALPPFASHFNAVQTARAVPLAGARNPARCDRGAGASRCRSPGAPRPSRAGG